MMKNYILMLGIAAVSIVSYCAYASNSATMTVTATIAHDVSLTVTRQYKLGTITIDPSQTSGSGITTGNDVNGGIISVSGYEVGLFTANIPSEYSVPGPEPEEVLSISPSTMTMGGITFKDPFIMWYSGTTFAVGYDSMSYTGLVPTAGDYEDSISISYTAP